MTQPISSSSACRDSWPGAGFRARSEEHTSELQSQSNLVCRLLLEKKNKISHVFTSMSLSEKRRLLTRPLACLYATVAASPIYTIGAETVTPMPILLILIPDRRKV